MNTAHTITNERGITMKYNPVTVDEVITPEDALARGIETNKTRVQLRQVIDVTYPAAQGNPLFPASSFGPGKNYPDTRVTWLNVPEGTTKEQIIERLNTLKQPTLVKVLDLKPILTYSQEISMIKGINTKTIEEYQNEFIRNKETGEPALYKNHYQYRAIRFSDEFVEDQDNRDIALRAIIAEQAPIQMAVAAQVDAEVTAIEQNNR